MKEATVYQPDIDKKNFIIQNVFMDIVHLASEFSPIAKVGGLGDVLLGLCRETAKLGHRVETFLPKYCFIDTKKCPQIKPIQEDFKVSFQGKTYTNTFWLSEIEGCQVIFLDSDNDFFQREQIYGYKDDVLRFLYFTFASMTYLSQRKEPTDILHLHDWHTSIGAVLRRELPLKVKGVLLSIHNLAYQGNCTVKDLDALGINGKKYLHAEALQQDDPHHPKSINLLKGGMNYSDQIVTVSPTYAKEIFDKKQAFGLEKTLEKNQSKIIGILNGIDIHHWNPQTDPFLTAKYSNKKTSDVIMKAKKKNKEALEKEAKLQKTNAPLFSFIGRLVPQKGIELLKDALFTILEKGGQFVLLGSSPMKNVQESFELLKDKLSGNSNIHFHLRYNEAFAHQLYSASDFVLIPSLYEPCGLIQMIALRYGSIPIARRTGGLVDTVIDLEDSEEKANGICFDEFTPKALIKAIDRAFTLYKNPLSFKKLIQHAMNHEFSWKEPTKEYLQLYQKLTNL